jgi:hypothetical protein
VQKDYQIGQTSKERKASMKRLNLNISIKKGL